MTDLTFGPLRSRDTPQQDRALRRVHAILRATATLLSDDPSLDISTTAIAARGGFPVSSIYRYFPTVDDVLRELYLQTAHELREKLFAIFDDTAKYPSWRDRLGASLLLQRAYLARHPYYRPLLMRFLVHRSGPVLQDEDHGELVQFLRQRWAAGLDGFHGGDPHVVADVTLQIALSMEDLVAAQPSRSASRPYSGELVKVLESYLGQYLSDAETP